MMVVCGAAQALVKFPVDAGIPGNNILAEDPRPAHARMRWKRQSLCLNCPDRSVATSDCHIYRAFFMLFTKWECQRFRRRFPMQLSAAPIGKVDLGRRSAFEYLASPRNRCRWLLLFTPLDLASTWVISANRAGFSLIERDPRRVGQRRRY
jgi:hypothetical protein